MALWVVADSINGPGTNNRNVNDYAVWVFFEKEWHKVCSTKNMFHARKQALTKEGLLVIRRADSKEIIFKDK